MQSAASVTVQAPSGAQQAPVGGGHVVRNAGPEHRPGARAQSRSQRHRRRSPSGQQQAPVGCPQSFGTQSPNIVQVPAQSACERHRAVAVGSAASTGRQRALVRNAGPEHRPGARCSRPASVTVQSPFGAQQAPVGCGHAFGTQSPNSPVPGRPGTDAASASASPCRSPSGAQQAPVGCGHGFGVQIAEHRPGTRAQSAASVTAQVPSGAQQAPVGCGHGSGRRSPNIVQAPGAVGRQRHRAAAVRGAAGAGRLRARVRRADAEHRPGAGAVGSAIVTVQAPSGRSRRRSAARTGSDRSRRTSSRCRCSRPASVTVQAPSARSRRRSAAAHGVRSAVAEHRPGTGAAGLQRHRAGAVRGAAGAGRLAGTGSDRRSRTSSTTPAQSACQRHRASAVRVAAGAGRRRARVRNAGRRTSSTRRSGSRPAASPCRRRSGGSRRRSAAGRGSERRCRTSSTHPGSRPQRHRAATVRVAAGAGRRRAVFGTQVAEHRPGPWRSRPPASPRRSVRERSRRRSERAGVRHADAAQSPSLGARQPVSSVTVQAPSRAQQEPSGGGTGQV